MLHPRGLPSPAVPNPGLSSAPRAELPARAAEEHGLLAAFARAHPSLEKSPQLYPTLGALIFGDLKAPSHVVRAPVGDSVPVFRWLFPNESRWLLISFVYFAHFLFFISWFEILLFLPCVKCVIWAGCNEA